MALPPGFQKVETSVPSGFQKIPPPDAPEEVKLSFAQRVGGDLLDRKKVAEEIMQATDEGEQTYAEGILQVVGKVGFGGVLDIIGEGLVSTARGVSAITPDFIEDPIKESAINTAHNLFLDTPIGQAGLEAAKLGMDEYTEFKETNPRAARNIEAVVDIALVVAPARIKAKPTKGPSVLERAANSVDDARAANTTASRTSFVEDLIRPKQTASVRAEQVGRTTEQGILRSKVVAPSAREAQIAKAVDGVPGVSPRNTLVGNSNAINSELASEATRLRAMLDASPARISNSEVRKSLDLAAQRLTQSPTIVGDAAKTGQRFIAQAQRIVADNPQTSSGLLKARQQFDKFVASQKPKAFDPAIDNATTMAVREVRQTLNNLIDIKNPTQGVRDSLSRQMNFYRALENIAPKAANEFNNVISRAWQNAMKVLPFRGEFNQMAATAFGVGGLGASAQFAPMFTKIVTGGLATYAGGKLVMSAPVQRAVAGLLRQMDDAIKVAVDADMIKQLRADRALIVELTKGAE